MHKSHLAPDDFRFDDCDEQLPSEAVLFKKNLGRDEERRQKPKGERNHGKERLSQGSDVVGAMQSESLSEFPCLGSHLDTDKPVTDLT